MYRGKIFVLFSTVICLAICLDGLDAGIVRAADFPVTLTDATGKHITMKQAPERIVSMIPSNTEILFALGLNASIVGVTDYCDFPKEAKRKPKIGDLMTFSLERIIGAKPDLVLATKENPGEVIRGLIELGITVFVLNPQTVTGVFEATTTVGRLTGRNSEADVLVNDFQYRLKQVSERLDTIPDDKRVSIFIGNPKFPSQWSPGPGTFTSDIIAHAGGRNIAGDITSGTWGVYSLEQIVSKDPNVILATSDGNHMETVAREILSAAAGMAGWRDLSAIKRKRVYVVTGDWIMRPGPRVILGVEQVARMLYPEFFVEE
ncbi:uncharacterized protein METZ01_LOCUS297565 [marine metagenome]|uniref:Fe/B12 periplasmic-binding domain-containing protein n=1 Tax=marine metagenome TaxID=408172 RepID=A0A382MBT6_9ZZZZ